MCVGLVFIVLQRRNVIIVGLVPNVELTALECLSVSV